MIVPKPEKMTSWHMLSPRPSRPHTIPLPALHNTNQSRTGNEFIVKFKELLKTCKSKAIRGGYWYGLSRMERSFLSLAARLDVRFESLAFLRAIVSVLKKLQALGATPYSHFLEGTRLAWAFSEAAVAWGNKQAISWRSDRSYVLFLGRFFPAG